MAGHHQIPPRVHIIVHILRLMRQHDGRLLRRQPQRRRPALRHAKQSQRRAVLFPVGVAVVHIVYAALLQNIPVERFPLQPQLMIAGNGEAGRQRCHGRSQLPQRLPGKRRIAVGQVAGQKHRVRPLQRHSLCQPPQGNHRIRQVHIRNHRNARTKKGRRQPVQQYRDPLHLQPAGQRAEGGQPVQQKLGTTWLDHTYSSAECAPEIAGTLCLLLYHTAQENTMAILSSFVKNCHSFFPVCIDMPAKMVYS